MGAAECEYSEVVSLTVEFRMSLSDDDGLQDGKLPVATFLLQDLQVVDEVCTGDLTLVSLSHVVEWRMLVEVHGQLVMRRESVVVVCPM